MNNQKSKLYPIIGEIAIGYGILSILFHWLSNTVKSLDFLGAFVFPYFNDPTGLTIINPSIGSSINPLNIFFFLLIIIGGLLYLRTNKRDPRLLQFTFSILFFKGLLFIGTRPLNYFNLIKLINQHNVNYSGPAPTIWPFVWPTFIVIPIAYFAYHFTKSLIANQQILTIQKDKDGNDIETAVVASKGKRFWQYTFDTLLILLILSPIFLRISTLSSASPFSYSRLRNPLLQPTFSILLLIAQFLYYLFFEGFFRATPIKFLTGTRVVHSETLENPNFLQITGRTLARNIPFDAFSFFGNSGWHDSVSKTIVVEENTQGHSRKYHGWWGVLFIAVFLGSFAYKKIEPEIQNMRNQSFQQRVERDMRKASLANLKKGDIILANKTKEPYQTAKRYFRINAINNDHYKAYVFQAPYSKIQQESVIFNTIISSTPIDTIQFTKQKLHQALTSEKPTPLEVDNGQTYKIINTYILKSSAYRTNLCPRFSNSLSKSSNTILDNKGDNGLPCGVPFSRC